MEFDPCTVCNGTELKLIDGFYYCVECLTQNTNVRETVVEQKALGDGTFALATRRKIVRLHDSKIQMSGEWYKWHAFNFIILGLADELVAVGAKPSFKMKLLWIWTRYIKKYQNKDELGLAKTSQNNENENLTTFMVEENSSSNPVPEEDEDEELEPCEKPKKTHNYKNFIMDGSRRDIKFLSRGLILSMLYLALNLDGSDIQLSHIYRFMKEKYLNFSNLQRFLPEDINVKSIQLWVNFLYSKICNMHQVRALAMSLLRKLDLGTPRVPDLRKIVDNFLTELCLPNDIKPLIYSLMQLNCCDFLDVNNKTKEYLVRIPDYEGVVMSYVLVAIKMCFGLDCDYEERLSDAVEKINEERDLPKSHRIGQYSEPSSRLFSFREWCSYMQFRKIMLCKCCLKMAEQHCLDIDDYVYMEHLEDRLQNNKELQDETAIDLIKKIPEDNDKSVIPKKLFLPTLTPMFDYTDIIIEYSQDPETRFLLSEDFTQYSLKYACEYLDLVDINTKNIIKGVSNDRKIVSEVILGTIITKKSKSQMVYVKNCENKNWRITNPPTIEHVTCDDGENNESNDKEYDKRNDKEHNKNSDKEHDESNDKESDHGYDSENPNNDKEVNNVTEYTEKAIDDTELSVKTDKKQVIITEEDIDKNIFDDSFEELDLKDEVEQTDGLEINNEDPLPPLQNNSFRNDDRDSLSDESDSEFGVAFNPETFDREQTIKELILLACKKYKITVPAEYRTIEPRKRKAMFGNEARPSDPTKRPKIKRGESKKKVEELLANYYNHLHSDLITKMHHEVSLAIRSSQFNNDLNGTQNDVNDQASNASADVGERSSICPENMQNQGIENPQNGTLGQSDVNKEQNIDENNEIDENLESKLFDDDEEMNIDDLIPKGDPKFDEEKYDVNQLYIKMKPVEENICDMQVDPSIEQILNKKIEERKNSTEFEKLNRISVKTKYESESEDEIPLNVLRDEKKRIQEMLEREENFDPLINKDNLTEFKYWFRHYDTDFMSRSVDLHKKFDEELKENTPASFYFILRECATILNSSTFYLYKHMQSLEQRLIAKAKNPD